MKKKVIAALLSVVLLLSAVSAALPFIAFAVSGNELFSCSFETDAEVKPYSGYYCLASNANGYKVSGDGYKIDNYNNLLTNAPEAIKNGHHMAIPVVSNGIGYDGSSGAMRLMYDGNTSYSQANPGFSIRNPSASGSFKPAANSLYSISFWYKVERISAPATIYIGQRGGALSDIYFNSGVPTDGTNSNVTEIVTVDSASSDWKNATVYCNGAGGLNLVFYMVSSDKSNQSGTSVLIDDISVVEVESAVLQFESNGGTPVQSIVGVSGESIDYGAAPIKINSKFAGWYTDRELTQSAPTVFPKGEMTLYAKWEDADTSINVNESFESYSLGKNPDRLYANDSACEISNEHYYGRSGQSLKLTCNGYQMLATTPQWVITNRNGEPAIFEAGKAYSFTAYVWVPETRQYNIRVQSVNSTGAESNCARQKELEEKKSLEGEKWNEISGSIVLSGIPGYSVNYLTLGISLTGGEETRSYVFYLDNVKFDLGELRDTVYTQDYESFEAKSYTGSEEYTIHGNGSGRTVSDERNHTENGSKSLKLNMNQVSDTNSARTVAQFDGEDFYVNSALGYTVSMWVYSDADLETEMILGITNSPSNFWENSVWVEAVQTVALKGGEWKQVTFRKADFSDSGYLTIAARYDRALAAPKELYIDDVEVTRHSSLGKINFITNGGNSIQSRVMFPNMPLGTLPTCEREGYCFEGWFDQTSTVPYNPSSIAPSEGDLNLYARWSAWPTAATSLTTGFEKSEYTAAPYYNTEESQGSEQINMSASAVWIKDSLEYANHGTGVMKLVNDPFVNDSSEVYQAFALMNSDGTRFAVIKGQRYRISYSFLNDTPDSAHSYVSAVISSDSVFAGIGASDQCLKKNTIHGMGDDWQVSEEYFVPNETGFVYIALRARDTTSPESSRYHTVYIDDVTVEALGTEYTAVNYIKDTVEVATVIGRSGNTLEPPLLEKKDGFEFTGWYSDAECTQKYTAYTYADHDITLYAGYKAADSAKYSENQPDSLTLSFEEDEFLRDFYNTRTHRSYMGDALTDELELINNPVFSRSGSRSIKMNSVEWHYFPIQFSLYNTSNEYGMLVLQPGEEYKITYYIMVDADVTDSATMMLWLTDVGNIESSAEQVGGTAMVDALDLEDGQDPWLKVEQFIENQTDQPKAVAMGYINGDNCCYIDDISILRVKDATVRFETNGGDEIDPLPARTGYTIEEPYTPYRDGYNFVAWYTDKELKNPVDFETFTVEGDTILYAGWEKDNSDANESDSSDTSNQNASNGNGSEKENDEKIDNGVRPVMLESDKIECTQSENEIDSSDGNSSGILWWLIVIISVGVIAVAALIWFIIVLKKKQNGRLKSNV